MTTPALPQHPPPPRRSRAARWWTFAALGAALAAVAVAAVHWIGGDDAPPVYSYEELTGSVFAPPSQGPFRAPRVRELKLPAFAGAQSIWGATGRDFRGHIWFGV